MKASGIKVNDLLNNAYLQNTFGDRLNHAAPPRLAAEVRIVAGAGVLNLNVFKFTGSIAVVNQWARITAIPDLVNCTNVHADVYDGTLAEDLTADGIDLSGAPIGTFFSKTLVTTQPYTLMVADQVRIYEGLGPKVGSAFVLTAKNGVDNFIRFNLTASGTLDFSMYVCFEYFLFNGATLEFA